MNSNQSVKNLLAGLTDGLDDLSIDVAGMNIDSRKIKPGDLFLAYRGWRDDGRDYIAAAITAGARCIVYDSEGFTQQPHDGVVMVAINGLQHKVGIIAARYYGHPSRDLMVIGVTGTNGKTSCVSLLSQALMQLGYRCGVIGTLGAGMEGELQATGHTTPDPVQLQALLAQFRDQGASHVCIEVSSHALAQGRTNGIDIDVALFTNLTRDHLDYHGSQQAYAQAKASLFKVPGLRYVIVNHDDPFSESLLELSEAEYVLSYGLSGGDVRAHDIESSERGLTAVISHAGKQQTTHSRLLGRINVWNILATTATLVAFGNSLNEIAKVIEKLDAPVGRMELFTATAALPSVVVDYAHTPDALSLSLQSIAEHCSGDLWVVFGCGGDRDQGKRLLMGEVADRYADHIVLTNDNPRHESASLIIGAIQSGIHNHQPQVILDRSSAIQWAISQAAADDWVLVAGKGHESEQQIGDAMVEFSDRQWVCELMEEAA